MTKHFLVGAAAMSAVLVVSNFLVQFPLGQWLTWAAFSYPLTFLVADCVNRGAGAQTAKRVATVGVLVGAPLSFACNYFFSAPGAEDAFVAALRIAAASAIAFFAAQQLDVLIFNRLRRAAFWWWPPLASTVPASAADTAIFFSLAFAATPVPWLTLALGDFAVKLAMGFLLLPSYRLITRRWAAA